MVLLTSSFRTFDLTSCVPCTFDVGFCIFSNFSSDMESTLFFLSSILFPIMSSSSVIVFVFSFIPFKDPTLSVESTLSILFVSNDSTISAFFSSVSSTFDVSSLVVSFVSSIVRPSFISFSKILSGSTFTGTFSTVFFLLINFLDVLSINSSASKVLFSVSSFDII